MKTITINIEEYDSKTPTVKETILEQIKAFNEHQVIAKNQIKARLKDLRVLRAESLKYLNDSLGEDAWEISSRDSATCYYPNIHHSRRASIGIKIGFRDGVYKNTCNNDWDLWFQTPKQPEQTLGKLSYEKLELETIEMYLCGSEHNNGQVFKINNISEVAKYLQDDYLTYFTRKKD